MRFREFNPKLFEFAPPSGSRVEQLITILKDPAQSKELKAKAESFLSSLLQIIDKSNPVVAQTQPVSEDSSDQIIVKAEEKEDELERFLAANPAARAKFDAIVAASRAAGREEGKKEAFSELPQKIDEYMQFITQLPSTFKDLVSQTLISNIVRKTLDQDVVFKFLEQCAQPNRIIDLPNIVSSNTKSGTLEIPKEFTEIVKILMKIVPGSSSAATGKGELCLALIGKDTIKPAISDIKVGEKSIEVKASDQTKSGVTDFVLGQKQNVEGARTVFVNAVNQHYGKTRFLDAASEKRDGDITGISSINKTQLDKVFNPIFRDMGLEKVQETFGKMFKIVGLDDDSIGLILSTFNQDGTVDLEKYSQGVGRVLFDKYKKVNRHDGLLTINTLNLTYTYSEDADSFLNHKNVRLERLFDFRPVPSVFSSFKQIN